MSQKFSPELKLRIGFALLAGQSLQEVADKYKTSTATASRCKKTMNMSAERIFPKKKTRKREKNTAEDLTLFKKEVEGEKKVQTILPVPKK
jgi:transposase